VKTREARSVLTEDYLRHWGHDWFMLANPAYGSWENVLKKPREANLQGY
jgi:predicted secreted acid phosphatase